MSDNKKQALQKAFAEIAGQLYDTMADTNQPDAASSGVSNGGSTMVKSEMASGDDDTDSDGDQPAASLQALAFPDVNYIQALGLQFWYDSQKRVRDCDDEDGGSAKKRKH